MIQDIYRETYSWIAKGQKVRIVLTYEDLEKVIADFKNDTAAFAHFKEFARVCRDHPDQVVSEEPFREALHTAIDNHINNAAQSLDSHVLEELLRREGLDVDWSGK